MIALSTQPKSWQAPWAEGEDKPVFYFRPATVTERELFEAEAAGYRAGRVFPWDLENQFFEGLKTLLPDDLDNVDRLVELRRRANDGEQLDGAEQEELDKVTAALTDYYPPFRSLIEQIARREAIVPLMAVRRFLVGWDRVTGVDNQPLMFKVGIDQCVPDGLIAALEPVLLKTLGLEIYQQLYAQSAEKNSEPPLKSAEDLKISGAAGPGRSKKTSGRKTRP